MAWEENKHPRDKSGQFTSKGNEGSGGKDKTEYKGAKIEKLTKLNGEEVYQFGTEDGDVLTFKSLAEAKEYVDKNRDDFDSDNDFEAWDEEDLSDEDIMQEISDGDYYYGGLGEQEIYNLAAERLNTTPEHVEQALKNQGFDYEKYQMYIDGNDDFDEEDDGEQPQPSKPMSYNEAKEYVKKKHGIDLDEETYNLIRGTK